MPPHPVIADQFFPLQRYHERHPLRYKQSRQLVPALAGWSQQHREHGAPWLARMPQSTGPFQRGGVRLTRLEQTEPDRLRDRMTLAADAELLVDVPLVVLDRARAQAEQLCDLRSRMTGAHEIAEHSLPVVEARRDRGSRGLPDGGHACLRNWDSRS